MNTATETGSAVITSTNTLGRVATFLLAPVGGAGAMPAGKTFALVAPPRRRGVIRALVLAAATLASSAAATTFGVAPAHAASNGGVYIVAPKWWGWCPNVGRVYNRPHYMQATNTTSGDTRADSGDDIIWIGVQMNRRNTVHVNVGCSLGHGSTGTVASFTPTRNGQTWFVSPSGATSGN